MLIRVMKQPREGSFELILWIPWLLLWCPLDQRPSFSSPLFTLVSPLHLVEKNQNVPLEMPWVIPITTSQSLLCFVLWCMCVEQSVVMSLLLFECRWRGRVMRIGMVMMSRGNSQHYEKFSQHFEKDYKQDGYKSTPLFTPCRSRNAPK